MELVQGSAALQRRARMELSAAQGPKEVVADLRKRFASLRRSRSYVDWRKQRALVKDLNSLLSQIETVIAPQDADEAFELLWSFLQLAPSIHERTDDSNGSVGDVFSEAVTMIGLVAPRVTINSQTLAERILDAVAYAGYGEFDGIIPETTEALGFQRIGAIQLKVSAPRISRGRRSECENPSIKEIIAREQMKIKLGRVEARSTNFELFGAS